METTRINTKELAKKLLDSLQFFITETGLQLDDVNEGFLLDITEEACGDLPTGKIVTMGCYKQLLDEMNVHMVIEAIHRLQTQLRGFGEEEINYLQKEYYELEVEDDG